MPFCIAQLRDVSMLTSLCSCLHCTVPEHCHCTKHTAIALVLSFSLPYLWLLHVCFVSFFMNSCVVGILFRLLYHVTTFTCFVSGLLPLNMLTRFHYWSASQFLILLCRRVIFHYMNNITLVSLSSGYMYCFHNFSIMDSLVMNISLQVFLFCFRE